MSFTTDFKLAQELDRGDELASFRELFVITDPNLIYLDGNSLGRLPKDTIEHLRRPSSTTGESVSSAYGMTAG